MDRKRCILFLMSDTGGGHRAAAEAISEMIHSLFPEQYKTIIDDIWQNHTPWPICHLPRSYRWLTHSGLKLWRFMWWISVSWQTHRCLFTMLIPVLRNKLTAYISLVKPDLIISVHPLMNHLVLDIVRQAGLTAPFVTIVTDLVSFHPSWINPEVDLCIVPTVQARNQAIKFGMSPTKTVVCGQPLRASFINGFMDKVTARRQLQLHLNCTTILVMGGAEGCDRIFDIARQLAETLDYIQLVVVAGRSEALYHQLVAVDWEIPTQIYGFADNVSDLMYAADILVTKAGPNTISEAFVLGLPILIFDYIPGQETDNVAYVQHHGVGVYAASLSEISSLVQAWSQPNNALFPKMVSNAYRLAKPTASQEIARTVCQLIS